MNNRIEAKTLLQYLQREFPGCCASKDPKTQHELLSKGKEMIEKKNVSNGIIFGLSVAVFLTTGVMSNAIELPNPGTIPGSAPGDRREVDVNIANPDNYNGDVVDSIEPDINTEHSTDSGDWEAIKREAERNIDTEDSSTSEIKNKSLHIISGFKESDALMFVTKGKESDVEEWEFINHIAKGNYHTVGLKDDGTVVAIGNNVFGQADMERWGDIKEVEVGDFHTVGLKHDGTVVAVGNNTFGQTDVEEWEGVAHITAGSYHTVGLKYDGTVVAVGNNTFGQSDVEKWEGIIHIAAGSYHAVGLKYDGTVVAVGNNTFGQSDVEKWESIIHIVVGSFNTVGLKDDGDVVAVGKE